MRIRALALRLAGWSHTPVPESVRTLSGRVSSRVHLRGAGARPLVDLPAGCHFPSGPWECHRLKRTSVTRGPEASLKVKPPRADTLHDFSHFQRHTPARGEEVGVA